MTGFFLFLLPFILNRKGWVATMCEPMGMINTFGDLKPETIYKRICSIVGNDQDVTINVAKTTTSIAFYGEKVFSIRINSQTQCLDTEEEFVFPYVSRITGAILNKSGIRAYAQIPLMTDEGSLIVVHEMLRALLRECFNRQNVEAFGCCNDHVRCSDARHCLHEDDKFYLGCIYRNSLETGRIFYGKNRNIEDHVQVKEAPVERYIVFDVETPNHINDRISSIGVVVVEGQSIVQEYYALVNPETHFDAFNIMLTGISPGDVADKPTFAEVWTKLAPIFSSGMLIAHNAPFDMSVLAKCLAAYQIEWQPYVYYACTCQMGRKCIPDAQNHKLNTLCALLQIPLEQHHCALDDAKACAALLIHYLKQGCNPTDYVRSYEIDNTCTEKTASGTRRTQPSEIALRLQALQMILKSISADGVLTSEEVMLLEHWMTENQGLEGNYPYDKVFLTVRQAMQDGVLDACEKEEMLVLFSRVTDPVGQAECSYFDIRGKVFCLTGEFRAGGRSQVEAYFVSHGGIAGKSITKKTDYLIVGELGSDLWSSGNYGSKVKKAMELQEKGGSIVIVRESEAGITLSIDGHQSVFVK